MDDEMVVRERHRERVRGVEPVVQEAARVLRRRETAAEEALWQALRGRKVAGLKFRRQHAVGPFVLDFYCREQKLVVEVDGGVHETSDAKEHDTLRQEHIERYGYRILRFTNDQVMNALPDVLDKIANAASSPPLPALGEGAGG